MPPMSKSVNVKEDKGESKPIYINSSSRQIGNNRNGVTQITYLTKITVTISIALLKTLF